MAENICNATQKAKSKKHTKSVSIPVILIEVPEIDVGYSCSNPQSIHAQGKFSSKINSWANDFSITFVAYNSQSRSAGFYN